VDEERKTAGACLRALPLAAMILISQALFPVAAQQPAPAEAPPRPLDVLREAGVLGVWSADCNAGITPANPYITFYGTVKGAARRRIERGAVTSLDGAVDSARLVGSNRLRLRLRNDDPNWGPRNGEAVETVFAISTKKLQAVTVLGADGAPVIREGHLVAGGAESPTLERCSR
jgi:hypothetical protein